MSNNNNSSNETETVSLRLSTGKYLTVERPKKKVIDTNTGKPVE